MHSFFFFSQIKLCFVLARIINNGLISDCCSTVLYKSGKSQISWQILKDESYHTIHIVYRWFFFERAFYKAWIYSTCNKPMKCRSFWCFFFIYIVILKRLVVYDRRLRDFPKKYTSIMILHVHALYFSYILSYCDVLNIYIHNISPGSCSFNLSHITCAYTLRCPVLSDSQHRHKKTLLCKASSDPEIQDTCV